MARYSANAVWWVYFMECESGLIYIGISPDPVQRFRHHQAGRSRFTRIRRPVELLAAYPAGTHGMAARDEWNLKQLTSSNKQLLVGSLQRTEPWQKLVSRYGASAMVAERLKSSTVE
jgi:putative endonuclease